VKVFVDTSVLLPLIHQDDQHHKLVTSTVRDLVTRSAEMVTTSYTLVEAGALVRRRLGVAAFRALGETVKRGMDVLWVDEDLHHRAWYEASQAGRDGPSLVDWVSFLAMRSTGIDTALSLDRHFAKQGFRTLP
jgi:predicted nucleic acid-binding protein